MDSVSFRQFVAPTQVKAPDDVTQYLQELQDTITQMQQIIITLNKEIEALKNV